jgi:hypothetical protein
MTTKIIVDAHAGWPVEVILLDHAPADGTDAEYDPKFVETIEIVPPGTIREFYIHDRRSIAIREKKHENS